MEVEREKGRSKVSLSSQGNTDQPVVPPTEIRIQEVGNNQEFPVYEFKMPVSLRCPLDIQMGLSQRQAFR